MNTNYTWLNYSPKSVISYALLLDNIEWKILFLYSEQS